MQDRHPGRVQDYTTASLVLIFINLLWVFVLIRASWGLLAVILVGMFLNHAIIWLEKYRARRAIESIRRGKTGYEEA